MKQFFALIIIICSILGINHSALFSKKLDVLFHIGDSCFYWILI